MNILTEQAAFLYNYLRTVAKDPINLKFDFAILKQWKTLHKGNRFTKGHNLIIGAITVFAILSSSSSWAMMG